ncbi:hypothetical protein B0H14DRAFT_3515232 [Mycena olivaceomarginata]|nr:hypothetical protein B0H14DRAFT_3515232 [Mycena olivaceomarginata]
MRDELSRPTLAAQSIALYLSPHRQVDRMVRHSSDRAAVTAASAFFSPTTTLFPSPSLRPSLAPISLPACSAHCHRGNGMTHTRALFVTSPTGLLVGVLMIHHRRGRLCRYRHLRPPSSSTKSKTAGSKKAEPHAMYTTPESILAVYALDVGGSTAEFSERWKALEQEKPPSALFQAYDKYPKELV